jgi:catechol 2,3-dioxygenase-like lactoylglutathione lyase family enzyme
MSLNYVIIGSNDLARSRVFYDAVMSEIGGKIEADHAGIAFRYRLAGGWRAWVALPHNQEFGQPGNGNMVGFGAASEQAVQAAHAAALANGGTNEGDPGPRPRYGPDFYGACARDPDGNKMSFIVVHNRGQ